MLALQTALEVRHLFFSGQLIFFPAITVAFLNSGHDEKRKIIMYTERKKPVTRIAQNSRKNRQRNIIIHGCLERENFISPPASGFTTYSIHKLMARISLKVRNFAWPEKPSDQVKRRKKMFLVPISAKKEGGQAIFFYYLLFPIACYLYTLSASPRDTLELLGQIFVNRNITY